MTGKRAVGLSLAPPVRSRGRGRAVASARLNVAELRRQLAMRGWNGVDLAYHAGVTPATVTTAMRGHAVSTATVRKLAIALARAKVIEGTERLLA